MGIGRYSRHVTGVAIIAFIFIAEVYCTQILGYTVVPQSFEAASVKVVPPGRGGPALTISPGGRFTASNVTLRRLIRWAYHVQDVQIVGGPESSNQPAYEIVAKADTSVTAEQIATMLQHLLSERFGLKLRRETRDLQAYALVISSSGSKLRQIDNSGEGPSRVRVSSCVVELSFPAGSSISQLANFLSGQGWMDHPVVDQTNLKGTYDLKLHFSADGAISLVDQGLDA